MAKFDAKFYDENHKELLRSAACFNKLESYVKSGFEINDDDFRDG